MNPQYAVILSNVGACADRFLTTGYSKPYTISQLFQRVKRIPQVTGVELVGNWHVTESNVQEIKAHLVENQLKLASIIPDQFGQMKWKKGSFAAKDPAIRREAVSHCKEMIDAAAELGGNLVSLWPGQDGYDYLFQADYIQERDWFAEGIKEVAQYRSDMQISLEYKIKEPRTHSYLSSAAISLLTVQEIGLNNVGVTIDFGHALNAYETPAESVALLSKYGNKLFHIHMNDNYRYWDDDMIVGSIHTIETLEFFYWLKRTNYQGWLSIDQYPYREDSLDAVREGVNMMESFVKLVDDVPAEQFESLIRDGNAPEATAFLRELLLSPRK
ncbi:sugar phosphate isomerase/epimerase [Paenibacillus sp. J5C_2022]|uniref:sugar phosphate isomerase/epimerase family protein n=1 Tax=Paenibacillus sp. J5C2022 TaxID=2977129 RepID=UPI0021CEED1C|nr:sugar phosphate isomerase/epimerase family protein [Paenibacillus sp. J5C2022]MCU6712473.1 sugar phosphate isomerase/epimerase [Paenibacillus sp. J5C2022]